ncbi:MAG: hypothetical protein CM15mP18_2270 [Methanobacteriota archaeon]|nr:MAG: hypothetical protein CM15mP18_2270 [Euryarchaeota archaeon]
MWACPGRAGGDRRDGRQHGRAGVVFALANPTPKFHLTRSKRSECDSRPAPLQKPQQLLGFPYFSAARYVRLEHHGA